MFRDTYQHLPKDSVKCCVRAEGAASVAWDGIGGPARFGTAGGQASAVAADDPRGGRRRQAGAQPARPCAAQKRRPGRLAFRRALAFGKTSLPALGCALRCVRRALPGCGESVPHAPSPTDFGCEAQAGLSSSRRRAGSSNGEVTLYRRRGKCVFCLLRASLGLGAKNRLTSTARVHQVESDRDYS